MQTFIKNLNEEFFSEDEIKKINNSKNVLIQLFCGEIEKLNDYVKKLNNTFKNAIIIGATTDGEIANNQILTNKTIASASIFENTSLKIAHCDEENEYETGKKLITSILEKNTKAIISFCGGLGANSEKFLYGINENLPKDVIFSGGLTGDNSNFKQTFLVAQDKIYTKGAIGVSLNSDILKVANFYHFGWKGIGIEHTITKAKENTVYEIDNINASHFYGKYLGKDIEKKLPKTGIIFPLIVKRNNEQVARAMLKKNEDGSLVFGGRLKEGEKVKLGIGKCENMAHIKAEFDFLPQSFFVFSCTARKKFSPILTYKEIEPFTKIANTSGFFTYGEFFTKNNKVFLFNHTMTILALSENEEIKQTIIKFAFNEPFFQKEKALWNLIETISKDYEKLSELLKQKIENEKTQLKNVEERYSKLISIMNEGVLIIDKNFKIQKTNDAFLKISNCNECEHCNKCKNIYRHIDEFLVDFSKKYKKGEKSFETLLKTEKEEKEVLVNISKIDDKCLITISDLSELKKKDRELLEKNKLAQMGEMVNMIAHQWRQPLNTISTIGILLELKASMNNLDKKEVIEQAKTIQNITQNMSKVIDDFLNLSKNSSKKETFKIKDVINEALNLIKAQLDYHDINYIINVDDDIEIYSYKSDILHILLNLITNARDVLNKSDKKEKKIIINAYIKNNSLYIEVEDNAGGIDEKIINRIFEPYFTTKGPQGTGLGLYMSKMMAKERLKGDIFVQNTKEGAKFTLKVPLEEN